MIIDADTDTVTVTEPLETSIKRKRRVIEEPPIIETLNDPANWDEKATRLAFYEEPVEIFLHETTNPTEEQLVFIGVNGEAKWLVRGRNHVLKRKFIETLARAKPTSIQTVETRGADGERVSEVRRHTALKYPFSIVRDDNPRGSAWAKELLTPRR